MSTLRLLAIEDEPLYAESLRLIIEELGYILIDVTDDISEFQRLVKATLPDLLLIDVDLGAEINGIQLANMVAEHNSTPVIFMTAAKDQDMINRAKTARPSAYIPKPYVSDTLQAAIELATIKPEVTGNSKFQSEEDAFFVKSDGVLKKVKTSDIQFIEVKEKFCHIRTTYGELMVSMRLKDLLDKLPQKQIIHVNQSFAVMKNYIEEVDMGLSTIKVAGETIPIGTNYRDRFRHFS